MHFFVDESGHTGQQLFDDEQPTLYYGVLSSRLNVDVLAEGRISRMRQSLGVERLHANELGNRGLVKIASDLAGLQRQLDLRFDLYRVAKPDHAIICFFDQVFDQGMNPSVPWHVYWTPMRYPTLIRLATLFCDALAKRAWEARISLDSAAAQKELVAICDELIVRAGTIPDEHGRTIIANALTWARANPAAIHYNAASKQEAMSVAPNTIGFQTVLFGIASRVSRTRPRRVQITIDRQSQFNKAQQTLMDWYQRAKGAPLTIGPGLPEIDLRQLPNCPLRFASSFDSSGLELTDVYLWIFKRYLENKELASELLVLIEAQLQRGRTDDISLRSIDERWTKWFANLADPTPEEAEKATQLFNEWQKER
jgi:hypothetical protein